MVSNRKYESKNIYLQLYIAEILKSVDETSALTVTSIFNKLVSIYEFAGTRRTVARNINGMSNEYKLLSVGDKPVRYWIDSFYEADYKVDLSPSQIQIILYSLKNLKNTSTGPLIKLLRNTEANLLDKVPSIVKKELKYSLKSYKTLSEKPKAVTYPKNNIIDILLAIRKKHWVTANIKDMTLDFDGRHLARKLAIINIWFIDGLPMLKIYDATDGKYKEYCATIFNSVKITKEKVIGVSSL